MTNPGEIIGVKNKFSKKNPKIICDPRFFVKFTGEMPEIATVFFAKYYLCQAAYQLYRY